ncbi:hypothetical protein BpHYR1_016714 [Brachionus plicatilis]|uniref:Uncharacterized protein n=1 Tax=Brachionus plicatilis TaxID=10195 RepID=A0A3M7QKI4_BRAPC|nr:hypothetical protein BpHYR1_016714 [Brachionus plicatilis]
MRVIINFKTNRVESHIKTNRDQNIRWLIKSYLAKSRQDHRDNIGYHMHSLAISIYSNYKINKAFAFYQMLESILKTELFEKFARLRPPKISDPDYYQIRPSQHSNLAPTLNRMVELKLSFWFLIS